MGHTHKTKQEVKKLTLKDISPYSERWDNIKREVEKRANQDFNFHQFDNIKKILGEFHFENIMIPSEKVLAKKWYMGSCVDKEEVKERFKAQNEEEFNDATDDFYDWLTGEYGDDIQEYFQESEHYPMWNTLFEARDDFLSEKMCEKVDEIYKATGIGVMDGGDNLKNLLFMSSAGHDFYEDYWIPLYCNVLGWVNVNDFKGDI